MTTVPKPDLVLRVAVAGQRELPEAARDGLARRLDAVYGALSQTLEALVPGAGEDRQALAISAYYSPTAPVLRLLTGLADGADQLAATTFVAEQRGRVRRTLAAVLPFDAVTYRDRSPVEDKQGFDTLLADCEHVIELDGRYLPDPPPGAPPDDFPKRCRARAYRAQAAVLLRQCDLLIAIADPSHQGRAGGTRETMERALALDIPVLFLPVGTDAVTLIGSREALEPEPDLALRTATPDWQEALGACVTALVAIPAMGTDKGARGLRESERAFLDEFFSEVEHRPRLRRRLWEWFARRFKDPGKAQPGSDPPLDPFRVYRARATEMNYLYIGLYRGSFLLNYVLAVVAVTLAVLGLIVLGAGGDHTAILAGLGLGKLAVLVAILRNTHAANHHDWNDKAIDYRYLAERLRAMFLSAAPGEPATAGAGDAPPCRAGTAAGRGGLAVPGYCPAGAPCRAGSQRSDAV